VISELGNGEDFLFLQSKLEKLVIFGLWHYPTANSTDKEKKKNLRGEHPSMEVFLSTAT